MTCWLTALARTIFLGAAVSFVGLALPLTVLTEQAAAVGRGRVQVVDKLLGWFGGSLDAAGQAFAMLGFQPGRRYALMAGLVEAAGGLSLALGFLTPVGAALVFSVMLVAAVSVHVKHGFFNTSGGYEYTLVLGVAGLALAFTGPGALSLDAMLGLSVSGGFWGVAAFFVGLAGGVLQLAQRRSAPSDQTATAA